jgi:ABC-type antimicrobial peptide transport system permease subunit
LLVDFEPLPAKLDKQLVRERLMAILSGFFGGLALLLATIGLYGVMSYTVARRRNEIGIRMALGASRSEVVRMIVRQAAVMLAAGVGVGSVLAILAAQTANTLLFGLKPGDPATLVTGIGGLAIVAMCASFVPALRASRLEPTEALRDE